MTCDGVQNKISSLLDRMLPERERKEVLAHIGSCRACHLDLEVTQRLRADLRQMQKVPVPAVLALRLRVLASHERARRLARLSISTRLKDLRERAHLQFDNLMRPFAVPIAGGLLSALLLFGMLMPTLSFRHSVGNDLQLAIATDPDGMVVDWTGILPRLESANAEISGDETVVELTIDEQGHVADYSVTQGKLTPEMQSIILFSRFTPAMFFGKKTWGKKLVSFRHPNSVRG